MKTNNIKLNKEVKRKDGKTLAVNQDVLEGKVLEALKKIKITEAVYKEYTEFMKNELKNMNEKIETQRNIFNMKLGKLRQDRMEYIEKYMGHEFRDGEEEIYNKHIEGFNQQEQRINIELENLSTSERNKELEFQMLAKILKNAGKYYEKATNVQKQKICKLLVSNLVLINETRLRIMRNPAVNILFGKSSDNVLLAGIEPASNP